MSSGIKRREAIMLKRFLVVVGLTTTVAMVLGGTAVAETGSIAAVCNGESVILKSSPNGDERTYQVSTGGSFKVVTKTFYDSDTGETGTTTYKSSQESNATCTYGRGSITFTLEGVLSPGAG